MIEDAIVERMIEDKTAIVRHAIRHNDNAIQLHFEELLTLLASRGEAQTITVHRFEIEDGASKWDVAESDKQPATSEPPAAKATLPEAVTEAIPNDLARLKRGGRRAQAPPAMDKQIAAAKMLRDGSIFRDICKALHMNAGHVKYVKDQLAAGMYAEPAKPAEPKKIDEWLEPPAGDPGPQKVSAPSTGPSSMRNPTKPGVAPVQQFVAAKEVPLTPNQIQMAIGMLADGTVDVTVAAKCEISRNQVAHIRSKYSNEISMCAARDRDDRPQYLAMVMRGIQEAA